MPVYVTLCTVAVRAAGKHVQADRALPMLPNEPQDYDFYARLLRQNHRSNYPGRSPDNGPPPGAGFLAKIIDLH